MALNDLMNKYLGEGGLLSARMPGFEFRPQQTEMAGMVARSLFEGHHLIVEAGTGTGKSLAYLIPAILWALENNKKVVISTHTKALQHQILNFDIPLIRERLGLAFRYSVCLGHENYLSLRRLKRASQAGLFTRPEHEEQFQEIFDWSGRTVNGLKEDLSFEPHSTVWEDVNRQKDLCMGKHCETYDQCFYFKERRKWFGSQLLIVNHHLFFANVASNGAVLPRFDAVIFDEAQNVEEAATSFLGLEISNFGLNYFLDRLHNPRSKKGILARVEHGMAAELRKMTNVVRKASDIFFDRLLEEFGRNDRVLRFYKPLYIDNGIYVPLQELHDGLKTLEGRITADDERLEISAAANRAMEFNNTLTAFLNQNMAEYVYWLEIAGRKRGTRILLSGVPINVSNVLREKVFEKTDRVVLTSATLTTDKGFEFIRERIGCKTDAEGVLDSPFDYREQALLYIPVDMPEPNAEINHYVDAISRRCGELVLAAGGKTFILFTSYAMLNRVYDKLEYMKRDYQLLRQGDLSPSEMIRRFKERPSVIFGTNSFWQGVDIPGEALQSVIITKLPFDVPSEPVTEARLEDLKKRSIEPFVNYQIPRAIIQLKQGFGRLIRTRKDTGVVSILDSRMVRRGYGKQFLAALPPCLVTDDLTAVESFFSRKKRIEV